MKSRDRKIFSELAEYLKGYEDRHVGIAIEYPYGSRYDSFNNPDRVTYYSDWDEVIEDQISDNHDSRDFSKLAEEDRSGWLSCAQCNDGIGKNPISITWRGESKWYYLCSSACLLRFAGKRDANALFSMVQFMEKRVRGLKKFIESPE